MDFFEFLSLFSSKIPCRKIFDHFCLRPIAISRLVNKKIEREIASDGNPTCTPGISPLSLIYAIAVKEYYLIDVQTTPCLCYGQKDFLKGFFEPLSERNTTKSASFWSVYHEKSVPPRKERQQSVLGRFRKFHELISFPRK